ncbi:MAG: SPASM domain-containing protein, partial [Candidatus Omnitrophota bacterium]
VSFVHLSANNKDDIKKLKLSRDQFKEFYFQIWPQILKKSLDFNIPVSVDPCLPSLIQAPINLQISKLSGASLEFDEEINDFVKGLYGKKFYNQNTCYGVLDHVTIDWEGNVFPCCAMPRSREAAIGNLHEASFENIWKSDKYAEYRKSILKGACQFKEQCSRAFRRTVEYNRYFKRFDGAEDILMNGSSSLCQNSEHISRYKAEKMFYYAFSKSEVYRRKFEKCLDGNGKFNFSALPFITRDELKNFFPDKAVVPNYFEEGFGVFKTSSCGSAAFLYARPLKSNIVDRMAASFTYTGQWKPGQAWLKLTSLNCLDAQYPLKKVSFEKEEQKILAQPIVIPSSDNFLSEPRSKIKGIFDLIRSSDARLIHANPSHFKLLLYRFKKEKLRLEGLYAIHSTYEVLLPSTERLIHKYLSCEVFNQYGCSEVGPVSFRCRHGRNHIFNDTVHVDVVPDRELGRTDVGRVIVTHLHNHVMPFVKYFNGDFAYVLKDRKCDCGLEGPVMGDIVGRADQIINYKGRAVFPLEVDHIFCGMSNILMYQVIFEDGEFLVKVVPEDGSGSIAGKKLISEFKKFFEDKDLQTCVEKAEFILPKRKGKYASVIVK